MAQWRPVALALLIGMAGATIGSGLSFPAPWLTGPALSVTLGSLAGLKLAIPTTLRNACFIVVGMTIGASVTPEMVATVMQWPASILILFIAMIAIMAVGAMMLERGFGYNRVTAVLGAAPGHLSFVLGLSTSISKVDVMAVSVIQSTRVLVLTLAVPLLAVVLTGGTLADAIPDGTPMTPLILVVTGVAAFCVAYALWLLRAPAAFLLGGILASSVGHLTSALPGLVPIWISIPAFIVMGTLIGTRFSGVALAEIRKAALAALAFTAVSLLIATVACLVTAFVLDVPLVQSMVAYAPGGLEAMAAMALLLGVNPAFVAAHHISRLLLLAILIPLVLRRAGHGKPNRHNPE
ncbi:MAG: AbrB family transcriptional regulator [Pseudomonadota bacterium]